jgi:hypothetical protein
MHSAMASSSKEVKEEICRAAACSPEAETKLSTKLIRRRLQQRSGKLSLLVLGRIKPSQIHHHNIISI